MVNELEAGSFHFTVLEAVNDASDHFVFRPAILGDEPHASPEGAWVSGVSELVNYLADAVGPMPPA